MPWAALLTVLVLWQPFVTDFDPALPDRQGLSLWWFHHPTQVAAAHLLWALGVVGLVALHAVRGGWSRESRAGPHPLSATAGRRR